RVATSTVERRGLDTAVEPASNRIAAMTIFRSPSPADLPDSGNAGMGWGCLLGGAVWASILGLVIFGAYSSWFLLLPLAALLAAIVLAARRSTHGVGCGMLIGLVVAFVAVVLLVYGQNLDNGN